MSYRNVDTEAYKKAYAKKKKSTKKPLKAASGSIDQRVQYAGMKKKKKKLTFKDETKKPENLGDKGSPQRPANLGDRGFKLKFGDAFRIAKKDGKKVFTWKGKKYTTQTLAELETGKSEKERFARAGKSEKATPAKKGFFSKIATKLRGGHETQEGYEKAQAEKSKAKRIAKMEKRKEEGKSYSVKNLAELKGSKPKSTYIAKKKKPSYSISS